ncbi:hypothetical protein B0T20DRAFT_492717 [Sordaria brevicollis]|uniref:Uncharacterized protein n=1 Tax=Sordaria brevicollis TaxID=83679 RepID=A0AAE0PKZ3_SORBR|nr:hypothetical protein B0T20DRAFT_492717 [Sordaria brevicollis]
MSELHQGSPVALEKAIKDVFSDLEKHLKSQREKLQDLYKEWNFWQAAGALLDFDRFEVSDFNITDLQIQLIQAQMDELRLENDLKGTMEFAREIFGQSASGFKTPSIPNPLPSADLFPLSAKYSHPSPPPKSYGRQMQQRRQEEDFPSYFRKRLATLPSIDPQLTVNPSQKPPTPPQTYPIRSRKPRPPPLRLVHPLAESQTKPVAKVRPNTMPQTSTDNLPSQEDLFFLRRETAYCRSRYGAEKPIHPTDGIRNYKYDPQFWVKNWDGTDGFWFKPSTKRGRMDDNDEPLSPHSVPSKRARTGY